MEGYPMQDGVKVREALIKNSFSACKKGARQFYQACHMVLTQVQINFTIRQDIGPYIYGYDLFPESCGYHHV
jgi:hypothetical protein